MMAVFAVFNVDCTRDAGSEVRGTVSRFQANVEVRDWDAACEFMTGGARKRLAEAARSTHELPPTCAAGLELAARRGKLRPARIEHVSAPWFWEDATVKTVTGRYRLAAPDQTCDYLITSLD